MNSLILHNLKKKSLLQLNKKAGLLKVDYLYLNYIWLMIVTNKETKI